MTFYVGKRPEPDKIWYQIQLYLPNKVLFFHWFWSKIKQQDASLYKYEWFGHNILTTKNFIGRGSRKIVFRTLAIKWSQDLRPWHILFWYQQKPRPQSGLKLALFPVPIWAGLAPYSVPNIQFSFRKLAVWNQCQLH